MKTKELIEQLEARINGLKDLIAKHKEDAHNWLQVANERQERIVELESQWISVEDRLPEEFEEVLIADNGVYCAVIRLSRNNYQCLEGGELIEWLPTHWMPLPTPPNTEETK